MVKVLGLVLYISILVLDRIVMVKNQRTGNDIRGYTQDDIAVILDLHNQYRRNTSSSNMRELVWNTDLENMAQEWADNCSFGHNPETINRFGFSYIGENLFLGAGDVYYPEDPVIQWYDEIKAYTYENNSCDETLVISCGHYLQVVWADTHDIGCGIKYCSAIEGLPAIGAGIVGVCNYGPGGNLPSKDPYSLGEPCTQCPVEAQICNKNLCSVSDQATATTEPSETTITTAASDISTTLPTVSASTHETNTIVSTSKKLNPTANSKSTTTSLHITTTTTTLQLCLFQLFGFTFFIFKI